MLSKTLDAAVKNVGFTVTPEHAYGIYGGYLVTVYETGNKKTAFINFLLEDDPDDNSDASLSAFNISETIKENLDKYAIIDYNLADDGLTVTTVGNAPEFLRMLDFCVELLNEYSNDSQNVKNCNYCSCCGKTFGKRYPKKLTKNNKNYLYCESCALELLEEHDKQKQQKAEKIPAMKRLLGVVGAIIGGLLGIFLYFAAYKWLYPEINTWDSFILNFVFALLGFATAFLVYIGYTIFCKRASLTAYISVSVIAVLFSVFGQYLGTLVKILANYNGLKFFNVLDILYKMPFSSEKYSSDFYTGAVMSLLLAGAGVTIFLLGLYEKSKGVKENLKIETIKIEK
jgi:hypothetical protein